MPTMWHVTGHSTVATLCGYDSLMLPHSMLVSAGLYHIMLC